MKIHCLILFLFPFMIYGQNDLTPLLQFESIGPTVMSGRVVDLDVNPDNPTEFYVAYASGGLWYTNSNGTAFTSLTDEVEQNIMGDIAVNWQNKEVWVGTGENNSSRSSYAGRGILYSNDNGKTWISKGLENCQHIGRIILHPENDQEIFVASIGNLYTKDENRGIYRSKNGGDDWEKVLYVNDSTGFIDLVRHPDNPEVLFASAWERDRKAWNFKESGKSSGIYGSWDGGNTWKKLNSGSNGFPADEGVGRIGLSIATENGESFLYAVLDNQNLGKEEKEESETEVKVLKPEDFENMSSEEFLKLDNEKLNEYLTSNGFPKSLNAESVKQVVQSGKNQIRDLFTYVYDSNAALFNSGVIGAEVYLSKDEGKTWSKTHNSPLKNVFFTYGYYFGEIRVNPTNPQEVYTFGVPFLKSTDGGKTWDYIFHGNVHVDHHALWINPEKEGHLILGNDGGLNISYDGGQSWVKCNIEPLGQFYDIHYDMAKPYNVYGGLQDNGVWFGPNTYQKNSNWWNTGKYPYQNLIGGDGMQAQVDPRDNKTVFTGYQFGNYYRINQEKGEFKYITPKHDLGEEPLRFNWQTPIHLSVHHPDILYFGSNKFHRSLDQGESWYTYQEDLTRGKKPGDVAYGTLTTIHESPLRFGLIYCGSDDGRIHVSTNGGYDWKEISIPTQQNFWVSRVLASAHNEGRVYATLNNYRNDDQTSYVYVSEDYGENWKPLGQNSLVGAVNAIEEDPHRSGILYVGSDFGLFVSLDDGMHFINISSQVDHAPVHDIEVHPREKDVIVGTHGRSIYKAGSSAFREALDLPADQLKLHVFSETKIHRERAHFPDFTSKTLLEFTVLSENAKSGILSIQKEGEEDFLFSKTMNFKKGASSEKIHLVGLDQEKLTSGKYILKITAGALESQTNFEIK